MGCFLSCVPIAHVSVTGDWCCGHTTRRCGLETGRADHTREESSGSWRGVNSCQHRQAKQSKHNGGEFDPGSGSTLAACLMHASRAGRPSGRLRGGRVRNTWATCPEVGDSRWKHRVIPHTVVSRETDEERVFGPALGGACGRLARRWGNGLPWR